MIVLLDANAIIADPYFRQIPWRILIGQAKAWELEFCVPRVSFLEAVGHSQRRLAQDANVLKKMAKHYGAAVNDAHLDLLARHDRVEAELAMAVAALGATFLNPVDVPHLDLVRRQVERRRPCKIETGDGYRDTLNWLTLLHVATVNRQAHVVWVSNDDDFTGKTKATFHTELLAEAEAAGVADRISLYCSVDALARDLLQSNGLPVELSAAHRQLCVQTICEYVQTVVLPELIDTDPVMGDLATTSWSLQDDIEVESQGRAREVGTVWSFKAPVQLFMERLSDTPTDATVTGLVTTDRHDRVTGGQIIEIDVPSPDIRSLLGFQNPALQGLEALSGPLNRRITQQFTPALRQAYAANLQAAALAPLVELVKANQRRMFLPLVGSRATHGGPAQAMPLNDD